MKTVLFVPGFMEDISSRDYRKTIEAIESKGYKVVFVPITWKYRTITDWCNELRTVYQGHDPKNTILAGFSYGAMTAFCIATEKSPSELWLFSISPYFAEDTVPENWKRYSRKRRLAVFAELSFNDLAPKVECICRIFVGELECKKFPTISRRASLAKDLIRKSSLCIVPGAGHDVTDDAYVECILRDISSDIK